MVLSGNASTARRRSVEVMAHRCQKSLPIEWSPARHPHSLSTTHQKKPTQGNFAGAACVDARRNKKGRTYSTTTAAAWKQWQWKTRAVGARRRQPSSMAWQELEPDKHQPSSNKALRLLSPHGGRPLWTMQPWPPSQPSFLQKPDQNVTYIETASTPIPELERSPSANSAGPGPGFLALVSMCWPVQHLEGQLPEKGAGRKQKTRWHLIRNQEVPCATTANHTMLFKSWQSVGVRSIRWHDRRSQRKFWRPLPCKGRGM